MTEPVSFTSKPTIIDRPRVDALLVEVEGGLLDIGTVERAAWGRLFDGFFERLARTGVTARPYLAADHDRLVSGAPRLDAIRAVLASRRVALDPGDPSDPPYVATLHGLSNALDDEVRQAVHDQDVTVRPTAVALARRLRSGGVPCAALSGSPDAADLLRRHGLDDLFDILVDAATARGVGLRRLPAPDLLLWASLQLGADPAHTVVVAGTHSGVQAARAGGFPPAWAEPTEAPRRRAPAAR